jgi:hypothetical protein
MRTVHLHHAGVAAIRDEDIARSIHSHIVRGTQSTAYRGRSWVNVGRGTQRNYTVAAIDELGKNYPSNTFFKFYGDPYVTDEADMAEGHES